jgi:hypothetical protein
VAPALERLVEERRVVLPDVHLEQEVGSVDAAVMSPASRAVVV